MKPPVLRGVALAVSVALAGCAAGPDFERPAAPAAAGYTPEPLAAQTASAGISGGDAQRFVQGMDIPGQWWTLFRSPALNALIERAFKANPDLQAAQAALRVAMENVSAQQGFFFPTVQANYQPTRQKQSGVLAPSLNSSATIFNLYTAQVTVSYAPDVFGGNRRQVESLRAQAESQRFQLEATYVTLAANVVNAAVQEASLRAQIAALEEVVRGAAELLELSRRQQELGAIAFSDVQAQEAALAQTQAALPPLKKLLAQQRNLLAVLTGRLPADEPEERFDLDAIQLPLELPVTLPSKLVEQRPDVRASEAQMHAASAQVGVAVANMLPQFNLTAGAGSIASSAAQLGAGGTAFWIVGASITQTLFAGGTLLHRKRAAEAALDQAGAQYRSTVLAAFQNVADTLRALQYDAEALQANARAERAAFRSLELAKVQVRLGAVGRVALLLAQQTYQQSVVNLAQARAARYADTAALFQALGGGWWNRPGAAASGE
jgi:NodT family efflux transporter outer membrane factor (OMF) lipoprotein